MGGYLPNKMALMTELTYVNFSHNIFLGTVPILSGSQKLQGIDCSFNDLKVFPLEYFYEDRFQRLEFINVNFNNPSMQVPEACRRYVYCYKRTVQVSRDGNLLSKIPHEKQNLIERSYDDESFYTADIGL